SERSAPPPLEQNPQYVDAAQKYEQLFQGYAGQYPALAAFKDNPEQMAQMAKAGTSPEVATMVGKTLTDKLKDIQETNDNLGGKLSIWTLDNIVSGTKQKRGIKPGSMENRVVDDKKGQVQSDESLKKIAFAALGLALGVISAVATAGGSLVVAGVAGVAG